jgi:membrane protease subunit (stomatin/prohibitin family)
VVRKLTAEKWPVLGIAARTAEIEAALLADVQAALSPYGVKITRLGNVTISLTPDDEKTLKGLRKDSAYTRLAGGFREYGVGAALKGIGEGAASGGGNGPAVLGVGLGLGGLVAGIGAAPAGPASGFGGGVAVPAPPAGGAGPAGAGAATAALECANCHAANPPGAKFCSSCGTAITAPKILHCTQCGSVASPGAKFCANCGSALSA